MDKNSGAIYLITNKINGKQYVGQTTRNIERRWSDHLGDARRGNKYPICRAIRKYGGNNFIITEIDIADSLERLNVLESSYIKIYNTIVPNGYNLDSGGKNTIRHPETGKKISRAKKGKPSWNKGLLMPAGTGEKISLAKKGRHPKKKRVKMSNETKIKLSTSLKGHLSWNKGKQMSVETRAKISASKKGKSGTKHTDDFKKKLSRRSIGNQYSAGRKQSSGEKKKHSYTASKRQREPNGRFRKYDNV